MKKAAITLLLGATLTSAAWAEADRDIRQFFELEPNQPIEIAFKVGALHIQVAESGPIEAHVTARCRRATASCRRRLGGVWLAARERAGTLVLEMQGSSKWKARGMEIEATLTVPANHPLAVEMAVGDLDIRGLERDLKVDVGVGEVRLSVARESIHSVTLNAGIGSAEIYDTASEATEQLAEVMSDEIRWHPGLGPADVTVDLGIGDISVRLR